jgi:hypothetical protein
MVTCRRETCGRQLDVSEDALDIVLEEDGVWQCPFCLFAFDPYADPNEHRARESDQGPRLDDLMPPKRKAP